MNLFDLPGDALADPYLAFGVDDDGADSVERLDELQSTFRPENEDAVVDLVRQEGRGRPDRDATGRRRGVSGAWIDDVVVAAAVDDVRSLVVTRGTECVVGHRHHHEVIAVGTPRVANAGHPRAPVGLRPVRE